MSGLLSQLHTISGLVAFTLSNGLSELLDHLRNLLNLFFLTFVLSETVVAVIQHDVLGLTLVEEHCVREEYVTSRNQLLLRIVFRPGNEFVD